MKAKKTVPKVWVTFRVTIEHGKCAGWLERLGRTALIKLGKDERELPRSQLEFKSTERHRGEGDKGDPENPILHNLVAKAMKIYGAAATKKNS